MCNLKHLKVLATYYMTFLNHYYNIQLPLILIHDLARNKKSINLAVPLIVRVLMLTF